MKNRFRLTEKARYFIYTLLCAFISVGVFGQRQVDTVDIMMMVSDTSEQYYVDTYCTFDTLTDSGWVGRLVKDTILTGNISHEIWWRFGKEVMELHNTAEGQIDPGSCLNCWHDYWVHIEYLDEIGYKLPKGLIVWQAVRRE